MNHDLSVSRHENKSFEVCERQHRFFFDVVGTVLISVIVVVLSYQVIKVNFIYQDLDYNGATDSLVFVWQKRCI